MGICVSKTGMFISPEVAVVSAEVQSLSFSGVQLGVLLTIRNPNLALLPVTRVSYVLKKASDGTVLSEGLSSCPFSIPQSTTVTEKISMTFKWTGLGAAGTSLVNRGKTKILVSGDMMFDAPMALTGGGTAISKYGGEIEIVLDDQDLLTKR